jgi:hypothetical protein
MTCGALTSVSFSDFCRRSAKRPASVNDGLSAKLHGAQRERYGNNKQGKNPGGPEHIYIGEQRGLVGGQPRDPGNGLSLGHRAASSQQHPSGAAALRLAHGNEFRAPAVIGAEIPRDRAHQFGVGGTLLAESVEEQFVQHHGIGRDQLLTLQGGPPCSSELHLQLVCLSHGPLQRSLPTSRCYPRTAQSP